MPNFFKRNYLVFGLLAFLVLATYANAFNNAFLSDDIPDIVQNPNLSSFNYVLSHPFGFIRPLLYWLTFHTFGVSAAVFRSINILFHLGNAWLVFLLVKKLHQELKAALAASAVFAVHPLLVEPVSWISGGAYVQGTFFFLLSFLFYLYAQNRRRPYYLMSTAFFALALLSQITTVVLPAALFLYEVCFASLKRNWLKVAPYVLLALVFVAVNALSVPERSATLQTTHYQESRVNNPVLLIPVAITEYLELAFFPKGLTLYHSELSVTASGYVVRLVLLGIAAAGLAYAFFKYRPCAFWLCFFLVSLAPTLVPSIFGLTWVVAERYAYLGSLGIFVPTALIFSELTDRKFLKSLFYPILVLLAAVLMVRAVIRNNDWHSEDNLWVATAKNSPSSPNTHNNMGDVYARHGDLENAAREFGEAISIQPNYADAYHNLANTYQQMGKMEEALESYQKAAQINPRLWQSFQNMAAIYFASNQFEKAEEMMKQAVSVNPQNANLHLNLGIIYLKVGDREKARQVFQMILDADPQNQKAKLGLIEAEKAE